MGLRTWKLLIWLSFAVLVVATIEACGNPTPEASHEHGVSEAEPPEPVSLGPGERLRVVATTNILGDVVRNVGGEHIELTTLMGIGVDPHSYIPTPADTAAMHDAHVVFANGVGLEANLEEVFNSAGGDAIEIHVSQGLAFRKIEGVHQDEQDTTEQEHVGDDPHVWFDAQNVIHWAETIRHTLSALDPTNAAAYIANASSYSRQLEELDTWIMEQVASIPEANRRLVTNHPAFGYLADRYGLEQLGAVYPVNPSSEPSARDIAALEDIIGEYSVPAVFVESTVNPKLAEQVAKDTGVKLVPLYSGSLGGPGSGAESYIELMRYDVNAIVNALK